MTLRLYKPQLDRCSAIRNQSVSKDVFGAIRYWRQIRERIAGTLRPENGLHKSQQKRGSIEIGGCRCRNVV